jgi:hypothetical protein
VNAADEQQLSQSSAPTLESDAGIAWVESGNDVLFTVTTELEVVDSYVCTVHAAMTGAVTYAD